MPNAKPHLVLDPEREGRNAGKNDGNNGKLEYRDFNFLSVVSKPGHCIHL